MQKYIILFLNIFLTVILFVSDSKSFITNSYLYGLIILILVDYLKNKSITYFQTWLLGFVFIIVSDAILIETTIKTLKSIKFLFLANQILVFGYFTPVKFNYNNFKKNNNKIKPSKWSLFIILFFLLLFIIYLLPTALSAFFSGRLTSSYISNDLILNNFINALGFILPSIIVFYFKEIRKLNLIIPSILCLPIFIILFMMGTRFALLFSFIGFITMTQASQKKQIKINVKLVLLLLVLLVSSSIMKNIRTNGYYDISNTFSYNSNISSSEKIASQMSPEGIVDMNTLLMNHYENNPHTYGKHILFLTYFWIPREIWDEKPTMLGYWLIRKYRSGFSDSHSSSLGFTGELYADFGYFSLFFVFIIGIILKWAERFKNIKLTQENSYSKVIVTMIYSYVFFFVRSPLTSTIIFFSIILVYWLFKKLLFTNSINK